MKPLRILSCGVGVNSIAMILECLRRGIKIDLILFADTGSEKPHTYTYLKMFNEWIVSKELPEIVVVKKVTKDGNIETLEENCLRINALPSKAYGYSKCSHKFKIAPMDKYVNNWEPAKAAWKRGEKIIKLIGYDADEIHRSQKILPEDKKYEYQYPLIDWDMGRNECVKAIRKAGLPSPGKSACFFCPSSKPKEVRELNHFYPDLMERALKMERNANLTKVKGLGRAWNWGQLLQQDTLLDDLYEAMTPEISCGCYDESDASLDEDESGYIGDIIE